MSIFVDQNGSGWRLRLDGRFDFSCRADFRAAYSAAPKGASFLVDFTEVKYVDSAALGMLLMLREHLGDPSLVTIRNCQGQPAQVLKTANFHRIFRFE